MLFVSTSSQPNTALPTVCHLARPPIPQRLRHRFRRLPILVVYLVVSSMVDDNFSDMAILTTQIVKIVFFFLHIFDGVFLSRSSASTAALWPFRGPRTSLVSLRTHSWTCATGLTHGASLDSLSPARCPGSSAFTELVFILSYRPSFWRAIRPHRVYAVFSVPLKV